MATRKRCKTCRHWRPAGEEPRPGYCAQIGTYPKDGELVEICSNGAATLYTAPQFGCILWEQKEPA